MTLGFSFSIKLYTSSQEVFPRPWNDVSVTRLIFAGFYFGTMGIAVVFATTVAFAFLDLLDILSSGKISLARKMRGLGILLICK